MAGERQQDQGRRLDELFAAEPDRLSRLSFEVAGIYFDWSKTPLDQALLTRRGPHPAFQHRPLLRRQGNRRRLSDGHADTLAWGSDLC